MSISVLPPHLPPSPEVLTSSPQALTPSPEPGVNPIHLLAAQTAAASASREVHIDRVDSNQVVLRTGPAPESLLERAERKAVAAGHAVTAAVHTHGRSSDATKYGAMAAESTRATSPTSVVLTDASGTVKKTLKQLYPSGPAFSPPPSPPASEEMLPIEVEEPSQADVLAALTAQPRSESPDAKLTVSPQQRAPSTVSFGADDDQSSREQLPGRDGLLHPPARAGPSAPVPTRRNTTGALAATSTPRGTRKMQHTHSQSGGPTIGHARTRSQTIVGQDLHSDILKEAEQIRRERHSKRSKGGDEGPIESEKVLVGNLIGEDHANYVLMYNMLTGIRIGVSPRCSFRAATPAHVCLNPGLSLSSKSQAPINR